MTMLPELRLRSVSATPVHLPMRRPLGTSAQRIETASLLLVDVDTDGGIAGHAYAFCYLPSIAKSLVPIVTDVGVALAGLPLLPLDLNTRIARYFKLPGVVGPLAMVASSIDTAVWGALATAAGLPLASLLGAALEPVRAYNSNGLGLMSPEAAADEAEELIEDGFEGVKLRLGRASREDDLAAVRAVRKRLPDRIALMVDFNQALTFAEAMSFCRILDEEGIYWIEEPIRHDDYRHSALIAHSVRTPLQIGENFAGTGPMAVALEAAASDYVMPDLDRIGGVTGWQRAAGLAASYNRELSSHLFPEVSVHLLAASPTRHWLEYVDWAVPLLEDPLLIEDGKARPSTKPGNGLAWNKAEVARFALD